MTRDEALDVLASTALVRGVVDAGSGEKFGAELRAAGVSFADTKEAMQRMIRFAGLHRRYADAVAVLSQDVGLS